MEVETETPTVIANLVTALEQATLMAKQLPTTTDQSHLRQIHTALHSAHHHLSLFLSHHQPPPPQPENLVSSAVGGGGGENDETGGGGEPMQMGDDEDAHNSRNATVEKVEERMRECFIQNKRPKRPLSPAAAAAAEQLRSCENGAVDGRAAAAEFDPLGTKLRALDLIYQFHA